MAPVFVNADEDEEMTGAGRGIGANPKSVVCGLTRGGREEMLSCSESWD